ncbi:hypothetical protein SETIT_5G330000v2 [Setaria italica]|uniref:Serpin domain-containing protein n=1 Tax=Setaria italica TaxID=4555 RepID=A0A368RBQ2_SETIT|nr:hypothetical protein SETIT_5G330000v2 [Setaria italica]
MRRPRGTRPPSPCGRSATSPAEVRSVPFKSEPDEARRQMNQWIESATAGRIKDLIRAGSISRATQAVLTNALYFKGAWSRKFDARFTEHAAFYLPNGSHVRVPFMSSTRDQHIARRAGYKVLKLPYASAPGGQQRIFSMYIYLPDDHYGLRGLLHSLSSNPALLESSRTMGRKVPVGVFMVPKFTISCKTDATEMLQALGLNLPFDPVQADLSEMVESPPRPEPAAARRFEGPPHVLRRGERGRDRGRRGDRLQSHPWLCAAYDQGRLRRQPSVHVLDQGGPQRLGGFRRAGHQPIAFALMFWTK